MPSNVSLLRRFTHTADHPLDRLTNEVRERYGQLAKRTHSPRSRRKHARRRRRRRRLSSVPFPARPRKIETDNDGRERRPKPERSRDRKHSALRSERPGVMHIPIGRMLPRDTLPRGRDAAERGEAAGGITRADYCPPRSYRGGGGKKKKDDVVDKSRRSRKRERSINVPSR